MLTVTAGGVVSTTTAITNPTLKDLTSLFGVELYLILQHCPTKIEHQIKNVVLKSINKSNYFFSLALNLFLLFL